MDVSERDTWGRLCLAKLQEFGVTLQRFTASLLERVTSDEWTQRSGFPDNELNANIYTQWDDMTVKFVCLFLFLCDVGITLRSGTDDVVDHTNPQFDGSPAFSRW